ncbi:hypothetical protein mRhiFer1_009893 [Rhinolophus ferrumequinum]|uniref:Uncharacterized protein n=1 Tax=Rhinolophus ferrumequinum TaxID=59479 RepID=A0A7J7YSB7_RHIFE|nr:hypothetical protein mRhiFer1_009893 [Rhinolophus ferrumequinum]
MILSMFAVQPYVLVTMQQGDVTNRFDTTTFSTFFSRMSFMILQRFSNFVFFSSCFFFSSSSSGSSKPSLVTDTKVLLDTVLINRLDHVDHFQAVLAQPLHEGRVCHLVLSLTCDVIDVFLVLLHPCAIVLERNHLITRSRCVVS